MSRAKTVLILGGMALGILGMAYGVWYAVFAEHQALDGIGASLAQSFTAAAQRNPGAADHAMANYREAKYAYDRQVDVHSHWLGLSMLLIIVGLSADGVGYSEKLKSLLAWCLLAGAFLFPSGVLMQTWSHGTLPRMVAIAASGLVIAALGFTALGFLRRETA
jgi:hypothetical protein